MQMTGGTIAGQIDIENIEIELKNVTEWLKMNKVSLNVNKTKATLFHMPQKKIIAPTIKINGTIYEFVVNFNCLCINLNKYLNWNPHVTIVSNKLVKTGVLTILKTSWLPSFARAPPTEGLKKLSIFSAVHTILTPKTSTPPHPPPVFYFFFGIFWAVHDTSRTFDFLTP